MPDQNDPTVVNTDNQVPVIPTTSEAPPPFPIIETENPTNEEVNPEEKAEELLKPEEEKKPKKKGLVAGIIVSLLLVVGIGTGVVLVKQQQDVRERATNTPLACEEYTPLACNLLSCPAGCSEIRVSSSSQVCRCITVAATTTTTATTTPITTTTATTATINPGKANGNICYSNNQCTSGCCSIKDPLTNSQGRCATAASCATATPTTDVVENTGIGPVSSGNITSCRSEGHACHEDPEIPCCTTQSLVCVRDTSSITDYSCQKSGTTTGTDGVVPQATTTGTSTTTSTSYSCGAINAYTPSWVKLSTTDLSNLKAGDKVRFTVSGNVREMFDKAKFKINGQETPEIIGASGTFRPGTQEFFYEYTIPAGVTSFTINATVHHVTLGWSI